MFNLVAKSGCYRFTLRVSRYRAHRASLASHGVVAPPRRQRFGQAFLLDVIGSKEEGLKQIFSSASEYSSLIAEYVQRFGDFQGFFTKDNVANLTRAAGIDASLKALEAEARQTAAAGQDWPAT